MEVAWTEELATGNAVIDAQHKSIFKAANDMLIACQEGRGRELVGKTISFLERYVVEHFQAEEKLMKESAYTGCARHAAEHREFMESFAGIREQFDKEGESLSIIVNTNHALVRWLTSHIKKSDRAFSDFIRKYS